MQYYKSLFLVLMFSFNGIYSKEVFIDSKPIDVIFNPCPDYTLINSVDFHPKQDLFCITCTHANQVLFYKTNLDGKVELVQRLKNPYAKLSAPQHAVFSPDGEKIVVANWTNQTLTIYKRKKDNLFQTKPIATILAPRSLKHHKPHGIALSPCGNYLAIAYGAASYYDTAIALFHITEEGLGCKLIHMLHGIKELPGIPKGITFSPDGSCLLATFCDINSLIIYGLTEGSKRIEKTPLQVIEGPGSRISRPEDVKISPQGDYCAISNSDQNTITFYPFDKISNRITQNIPCNILQNPKAGLCFPHGIAFSPDGSLFLVTEFGRVGVTKGGDITWNNKTSSKEAKCKLYSLLK